jgi:hypothetical protein
VIGGTLFEIKKVGLALDQVSGFWGRVDVGEKRADSFLKLEILEAVKSFFCRVKSRCWCLIVLGCQK